jgi:hypothetical protein
VIFWFRSCIRWNISASSTVIAAMGMAVLYCMPVWTEEMEKEVPERTSAATAPYFAARSAPVTRYYTDSP